MAAESARTAELLADILRGEAAAFAELADLARDQRRALLATDEERLNTITGRAETVVTRFRLLDQERVRMEARYPDLPEDADLSRAREGMLEALGRLLRETAISNAMLERLGDTVSARQAAVGGLFGNTYLPNGRTRPRAAESGRALCAEG